ncbi:unnamed protein product, partial [Pylaiella littoralis]
MRAVPPLSPALEGAVAAAAAAAAVATAAGGKVDPPLADVDLSHGGANYDAPAHPGGGAGEGDEQDAPHAAATHQAPSATGRRPGTASCHHPGPTTVAAAAAAAAAATAAARPRPTSWRSSPTYR